jgi:hypothetical protein
MTNFNGSYIYYIIEMPEWNSFVPSEFEVESSPGGRFKMAKITKVTVNNKEKNIDEKVISLSDDENSWGEEISVSPGTMPTSIRYQSD